MIACSDCGWNARECGHGHAKPTPLWKTALAHALLLFALGIGVFFS